MVGTRVGPRGGRVVALSLAAAILLGCADDDPDEEGAPPTETNEATLPSATESTSTTAPTTSTTADEQEVAEEVLDAELRAAYELYWETIDSLFAAPDPEDPRLSQVATGLTFTVIRDGLARDQAEGVTVQAPVPSVSSREVESVEWEDRGDPGHDPRTVTEAIVEACQVDDLIIFDSSGAVLNDDVSTARWELTIVLENDAWKVARSDVFDQVEGVGSCED